MPRRDETVHAGFSWHTCDGAVLRKAIALLEQQRLRGGKTAVVWPECRWLVDGIYLPWKTPQRYTAGYDWFVRLLGELVETPGQSDAWRVVGHTTGYDAPALSADVEASRHGAPTQRLRAKVSSHDAAASRQQRPDADNKDSLGGPSKIVSQTASAAAPDPDHSHDPACPALKLARGGSALAITRDQYRMGSLLGEGGFGQVYSATTLVGPVVIKALKLIPEAKARAFTEAYILDRCRGHAHIVQLLDVFVTSGPSLRYHLVFELWGRDLAFWRKSSTGFAPACVRSICQQLFLGLAHVHSLGLIHTDIKPANILAKSIPDSDILACKLADVGNAVERDPRHRLRSEGSLEIQTLPYRSPEVLFLDRDFTSGIDLWSCGVVLAELAGRPFTLQKSASSYTEVSHRDSLFRQLGTPTEPQLTQLPGWSRLGVPMKCSRQLWLPCVWRVLGAHGVDLLNNLLSWVPSHRLSVADALRHNYFRQESFALAGCPDPKTGLLIAQHGGTDVSLQFTGKRHPWNVNVGMLAPEVLQWLRADPIFQANSSAQQELGLGLTIQASNMRVEEDRKLLIAGSLGACSSAAMCGLNISKPLPSARTCAWFLAFRECNKDAFVQLQALSRSMVLKLGKDELKENGNHFLDTSFEEWFLTCGEMHMSLPGDAASGLWREPWHQDGAGSVLHLGLTLWGRRHVRFKQTGSDPELVLPNEPGSVYFGQITGAEHRVEHQLPYAAHELLHIPNIGDAAVTVMARTALFPHCRSRQRNTTPSPPKVFFALAQAFRLAASSHSYRLPTLAECEHAHTSSEASCRRAALGKRARAAD